MQKVFIQKMKAMSSTDWIDELDNQEDAETFFQSWKKAVGVSRYCYENGFHDACLYYLAKVQDDEMTTERGIFSATDAKQETKKRTDRDD